ncbi:SDR family oxidoreductase [Jannaschia sp. Os4]|uniref:SDR family NAD(P)-dependent oxidoreductase n=1 Tax=Jannaschia sp. Os4 TaxID=2807617 RepID=UPI001939C33D|nr:SDR family oxidoreductase [Jannaschia sp. Os4]MBM2578136.1 SDR family oxidoreductase [Jannaschia sp. Os4]
MTDTTDTTRRGLLGAAAAGLATVAATRSATAQEAPAASPRFADRHVLITGATSGIGEGTARAFAAEGAKVSFNGRRAEMGERIAAEINADPAVQASGGGAFYMQSDVREEAQIVDFVRAATEYYGPFHVAFNNAGVVFGNGSLTGNGPLAEIEAADFDDVWATNGRGVFLSMKHEIPVMLGNEPWGRHGLRGVIVNNASVSAHGGFPGIGPYSTSKHGVLGLTRGAALDYGMQGIRINSISPGGVDTPMRRASIEAQGNDPDEAQAPNVRHTTNTVTEMADVVMFLAMGDAPSSIQGTDLDVTMGMLTGPFAPPNPNT